MKTENKTSSKIAQVIRRFHFDEWGGTETVVWNSSLILETMGIQSDILTTKALCDKTLETREEITIQRFDYLYPLLGLTSKKKNCLDKKGGNPYSWSLLKNLLVNNYRIYHSHAMQRVAAMVYLAARCNHKPFVLSLHGGYYHVPENEITDMVKPLKNTLNLGKIFDIFMNPQNVMENASGIICVGKEEYETTKKRYPKKPVIHLPNGVDVERFEKISKTDVRSTLKIDSHRKILLNVSRIDHQKNQSILLDLLKHLNEVNVVSADDYHLVLVGPITQVSYYEDLIKKINELNLADQVTIIPGLKPTDDLLTALYQQSNLFILPSIHEPFGIVALEAWAAGLPVIASKVGGLIDLIKDEKTGFLVDPTDIKAMTSIIEKIQSNSDQRNSIIYNAKKTVFENYSWAAVCKKLVAFYDKVEHFHYEESKSSYCHRLTEISK